MTCPSDSRTKEQKTPLTAACACVAFTARECYARRYNLEVGDPDDGKCECYCHVEYAEEEGYDDEY